jgi:transcription elongation factor GreA
MTNDTPLIGKPPIELTQDGYGELQTELEELKDAKLPQVIVRVATARDHGDLSENSEYHAAREEQQLVETRIDEIESILANSIVVQVTKSHVIVGVGSTVVLQKKGQKTKITMTVVGEFESEPGENKVSSSSPLGKSLIGKKKGDKVIVKAPAGEIEYTVLELK